MLFGHSGDGNYFIYFIEISENLKNPVQIITNVNSKADLTVLIVKLATRTLVSHTTIVFPNPMCFNKLLFAVFIVF